MNEKILKQNIEILNINNSTTNVLNENQLNQIGYLCKKSKTELKRLGLAQKEINKIQIELQLLGLNLRTYI